MNERRYDNIEYSEYEDEHGVVAMFYDPENRHAWIRASTTVPVRR